MKTLLILSDTHNNIKDMEKLVPIMKDSDYIIHLGDYQKDIKLFREFSQKIYSVKGNCDGGGDDLLLEIEKVKLLLTHGDRYSVKTTLYNLLLRAKEVGANAVLYGHTHIAKTEEIDKITFINPGTLSLYSEKTYAYCVISGNKIVSKTVNIY
ncbi:MAG: metallophosphoesterase [Clostridia bacterium]|nr:metallophosphoesterase [Clostridia bacterium]